MALRERAGNDLHTVLPLIAGEHGSILLQSQQMVERSALATEAEREQLADQAVRLEVCIHTSAMVDTMGLECHILGLSHVGPE